MYRRKKRVSPKPKNPQTRLDHAVAVAVTVFVCLAALFPIRNNDIWWHLAVGREMLRAGAFITEDPFSFTLAGTPWVPHAWLSGLLFYAVHAVSGALGLLVLRAALVTTIFLLLWKLLRRLGVSLTLAAPVVLVAALNMQSRFILRPHLFEYLLMVLLLGHLLCTREHRGARFFVLPVAVQLLWVNLHASFYLGIVLVVLFYTGEWLSSRLGLRGFLPAVDWRRVALLLVLMTAVSFVNPSPWDFVSQPLDTERRELLTAYTLEWRSPFAPAMKQAPFHPYYEMLLVFAAAAFLMSWRRLRLSSLLIVGFFAVLSLNAHRFRVEFALAAVPLVLGQIGVSPVTERFRRTLVGRRRMIAHGACVILALVLGVTARDRITIDGAVSDRFPTQAFDFVGPVLHRPHGDGDEPAAPAGLITNDWPPAPAGGRRGGAHYLPGPVGDTAPDREGLHRQRADASYGHGGVESRGDQTADRSGDRRQHPAAQSSIGRAKTGHLENHLHRQDPLRACAWRGASRREKVVPTGGDIP